MGGGMRVGYWVIERYFFLVKLEPVKGVSQIYMWIFYIFKGTHNDYNFVYIPYIPRGLFVKTRFMGGGLFERGAYSRVGAYLFKSIQEWGLFLRHIRTNKKYLFILYFQQIIFCQYRLYYKSCIPSVTKYEIE